METTFPHSPAPTLTKATLWLMTIGSGLVVANIYYNQPLLGDIARTFQISEAQAGNIAMCTQIGYALGMLLIVPMGDMLRRKRLIITDFTLIIVSLLTAAFAPNLYVLMGASLLIGISSVVPQLFVPLAAHLAKPEQRGKAVGTVMSGLLIGILLSRTLSGLIGAQLGWRAMFLIAAGLMVLLWIALYRLLPEVHPEFKGSYKTLMASLIPLIKNEPVLRMASLRGALLFASFSAFWTTLVFFLEGPPYNAGSEMAGAFGLIGAVGAFAAPVVGKMSDKVNTKNLLTSMILLVVISFVIYGFFSSSLIGLISGVILMDLGLQAAHISNQTAIFALNPQARNRLNTVYMVSYFIGGASGTFLASQAWHQWQWMGVVGTGLTLSSLALIVHLLFTKSKAV